MKPFTKSSLFMGAFGFVFGLLGLAAGEMVDASVWRTVLAGFAGALAGVGMAFSLLHVHRLHRR